MSKRRHFGSIRRLPSGRWQARYRDPLTGRRWVPAPHTFETKGDASRWLSAMESGAMDPVVARERRNGERLGDYATEWIATRQLSARTRELYELQLRLHIAPKLGEAKVSLLEARHIRAWHADLLGGHLGEVSVAKCYRLLRSILNTAVEDGLVQRNPCQIKGAGLERSPERQVPTIDQVAAIADHLPPRLAPVPWVAALGALRKGEIFGLARRHIDLGAASLRVERALQEQTGRGAVLKPTKTRSSNRTVGAPERLISILATHLEVWVDEDPEAFVFTNAHGRPVRAAVWTPAWATARERAGIPTLRLHDLRHLAGTLTAQAGATTKETMDRLGHSSAAAALRYQHVIEDRRHQVAMAIDELVGVADGPEGRNEGNELLDRESQEL